MDADKAHADDQRRREQCLRRNREVAKFQAVIERGAALEDFVRRGAEGHHERNRHVEEPGHAQHAGGQHGGLIQQLGIKAQHGMHPFAERALGR